MSDRLERGVRATAVAAGLLALLAIVALASSRGRPETAGTTDVAAVAEIRDVILSVGITLYVVAVAVLVLAVWRLGVRKGGPLAERRGLLHFIVFMLLMGVAVWAFRHRAEPNPIEAETPFGTGVVEQQPAAPQEEPEAIPPAQFRWDVAIAVAAAAVAAAAGIGILVARRRAPVALSPHEEAATELAAVVEGTLADVRREADPRRAVIAAYAQMERILARHGLPRLPAEAPFEFLGRILRELRVRASSALALTELFERARFSRHVIDATMKDEAIEALVAVRDDLRSAS